MSFCLAQASLVNCLWQVLQQYFCSHVLSFLYLYKSLEKQSGQQILKFLDIVSNCSFHFRGGYNISGQSIIP